MNRICFALRAMALLSTTLVMAVFGSARAQSCNPNIPLSTPDREFVDHGDGTVTHRKTGLMWSKCLLGQSGSDCSIGSSTRTRYTWKEALEAADTSTIAGYSDWRLPNIKELESIVEDACYGPSINLSIFPNTPSSDVWSSSPRATHLQYAWVLYFYYGYDLGYARRLGSQVRLVRDGQ